MTSFSDSFTRADGTTNGVNGWASLLGTWTVASNELKVTSTNTGSCLVQTGTPMATPDHYAEIRVRNMVSTFGPICRNDGGNNNFYMLRRHSGTTLGLYKNVAGTTAVLTTITRTLVAGDTMRIEAVGSTIKGYVNGVEVTSVTDTSLPTGLITGIRTTGNAQNGTWDDFVAADVSVGDTTAPTVSITSPADLGTISGTVDFTATASDSVGVSSVVFKVDGVSAGSATLSGGVWTLAGVDTTAYSNASHTIVAEAKDAANNTGTSTITVTVDNSAPSSTSKLFLGLTQVTNLRAGLSVPSRVYKGTTRVFGEAPETPSLGTTSFGPNGTHYPANTPDPKAPAGKVIITSAPTGSAIRAALNALTTSQIDQGVIIALTSGALSSSDTWSSLDGFQNTRTNRITICPKSGYGLVTTSANGIVLTNVRGINICGMSIEKIQLKGCNNVTLSRSQINFNYVSITTTATYNSDGCGLYEVVMFDSIVKSSDSAQFQNQTSGRLLSNVTVAGSVLAPSFYVDGIYNEAGYPDRPHTDTLQLTSSSSAPTQGIHIVDSQIWTSNNCAVILSGPIDGTVFEHTLIVAGTVSQVRYPFKPGGAGYEGAINGPGTLAAIQGNGSGNTDSLDSVMIGQLSPTWRTVTNSKTNLTLIGWTTDPALVGYSDADFVALGAPRPTPVSVAALWAYSSL